MLKRIFSGFTVLTLMIATGFAAYGATAKQPTMAILPFRVGNNMSVVNIDNVRITAEIVENEFTNQVTEFMVRSRKFSVLNRTTINRIMDENKLSESEWAKPGQEQYVGKLLVADYLVTGNINRLEFRLIPQNIAITGENTPRLVANLKCQYKVTQVSSGRIVAAGQVKQTLTSEDLRRRYSARERRDWGFSDYKDILFRDATQSIGNDILCGIYPIKVASVQGEEVMLNRGDGAGLSAGQRLTVFNTGDSAVVDPDTGEVLGVHEKEVGTIEITEVTPRFSKARIVSSREPITAGALCKFQSQSDAPPAPDYPRATPGW